MNKKVGNIYILSNKSMPGLLKIGYTQKEVQLRAEELSSQTAAPLPFKVEFACMVESPEESENLIHRYLSPYRINPNREFFRIDLEKAINDINLLLHSSQESLEAIYSEMKVFAELLVKYPERFTGSKQEKEHVNDFIREGLKQIGRE